MSKKKLKPFFIAVENGVVYTIGRHSPRAYLLDYFNRKHADKMYHDVDGKVYHTGYIIAGHWLRVFELKENLE